MVSRCLNFEYQIYEIEVDSNFKMNIFSTIFKFKDSRQDLDSTFQYLPFDNPTNAQILEFEKMCTNITDICTAYLHRFIICTL